MLLLKAFLLSALLAQSSMDQRSPFGANAPDNNDVTPQRVPANRPDDQSAASLPSADKGDRATSTGDTNASSATPAPAPAESTPPASLSPPAETSDSSAGGGTPSTTRSANTPPLVRPDLSVSPTPGSVTPGTQRSTSTPIRGASGVTGTTNSPGSTTVPTPATSSPTYPGASSGASNTR